MIEWGVAHAALAGEPKCGDCHLVKGFAGGALVAVLDGIGHGAEANRAAEAAASILAERPDDSIVSLVKRCHDALRGTRGVVMSLASFNFAQRMMAWCGVGNVEGLLVRSETANPPRESLLLRAGVLGHQLPALHSAVVPVVPGDTLIFTTDGIRHCFDLSRPYDQPPQKIADDILTQDSKGTDDSLVLVARYIGTDGRRG
ncbi:MAG TPA: SpoIIE family protein phosphatase [Candidatus Binatia bacterium]|nr:SpoIIE family protein phosphatase [Candidatus Binatia bacterium]